MFVYIGFENMRKVAVITGATAGIGSSLSQRLLATDPSLILCLACRNKAKAETTRKELLVQYPSAQIDIVICDVSKLSSVTKCSSELRQRYSHIDYIYLNAGVMQVSGVGWSCLFSSLFSIKELAYRLSTGNGLLRQIEGDLTEDGLQQTFATNLFGHFTLIQELMPVIGGSRNSQMIWTSSSNASKEAFSLQNIQHRHGSEPYASSKYAVDLLSNELNARYNSQGIYSHVTCPGLVMTNLTNGILPEWIWRLIIPLLMLFRLIAPSMTITPFNGCEALVWLLDQKPEKLDPMAKFYSRVSITCRRYVINKQMDINQNDATALYGQLDDLSRRLNPS